MNNEERLFEACLSETNIKNDLNEILEYFADLLALIKKYNPQKLDVFDKHEDDLIKLIIKDGLKNFYSSKIKLYIHEGYDEDNDNVEVKESK